MPRKIGEAPADLSLPMLWPKKKNHIETLIEQGENQHLDFKFAVNDSRKIARSMVAFANSEGGTLLIGVKDNGSIAGVRTEEELHMVETAASLYTRPEVKFESIPWNLGGKKVLEVKVMPGEQKPYLAPDEKGRWMAWVRNRDRNILAPAVLIEFWKKQMEGRQVVIEMGIPEKLLLRLFETQGLVSLEEFSELIGISRRQASRIIIDFMLMGIAECRLEDDKPYFCRKPGAPL